MPQIQQMLAPNSISEGSNDPTHIVVHYTATNARAYNNALYFLRGGSGQSSAHYFLDGSGTVYQSVPDNRGAWHAGNYECNTHSIGIEVVSAGQDFTSAEIAELAWLVRRLMAEHGIPASNVIRHYDVADVFGGYTLEPHKHCPAPYVDGAKWAALKATITSGSAGGGGEVIPISNEGGEVYRLYNPNSGRHHYTNSAHERDALAGMGWKREGVAWTARAGQRRAVYRLYNPNDGDHLYTASFDEAKACEAAGWQCEGVPFFGSDDGAPVYRLSGAEHFYTADANEYDALGKMGWAQEGVAFRI